MPNDKRFDLFNVSGIKYRVAYRKNCFDLMKFDYVLQIVSLEKTPMSIYDFRNFQVFKSKLSFLIV